MALQLDGHKMAAWVPEQKDIALSKTSPIEVTILSPTD